MKLLPETAVVPLEEPTKNAPLAMAPVTNTAIPKSLVADAVALAGFLPGNKNFTTEYRHYLETAIKSRLIFLQKFSIPLILKISTYTSVTGFEKRF